MSKIKVMVCTPMSNIPERVVKDKIKETRIWMYMDLFGLFNDPDGPRRDEEFFNFIENRIKNSANSFVAYDNYVDYHFANIDPLPNDDSNPDAFNKFGLLCLSSGLKNIMVNCDYVIFTPGFANSRGCIVELVTAIAYGKKVICLEYNDEDMNDDKMTGPFSINPYRLKAMDNYSIFQHLINRLGEKILSEKMIIR